MDAIQACETQGYNHLINLNFGRSVSYSLLKQTIVLHLLESIDLFLYYVLGTYIDVMLTLLTYSR